MRLIYLGHVGTVVPLPEGWPAADHDEPNTATAKAKLASGKYQADKPPRKDGD